LASDNWIVENLQNALNIWNEKMGEIFSLLTTSPTEFKGGGIWDAITVIHGAVQAIGLALLVLFFVVGVVKTCGSFAEAKFHYRDSLLEWVLERGGFRPFSRFCALWIYSPHSYPSARFCVALRGAKPRKQYIKQPYFER
jgi:hypothetical protein